MSRTLFGIFVLIGIATAALPAPVAAQTAGGASNQELAAQSRTRITIYPRRSLSPSSKRHCRAWLAQEYRVSGPVIVPREECRWD
jgi:hypothetical protein